MALFKTVMLKSRSFCWISSVVVISSTLIACGGGSKASNPPASANDPAVVSSAANSLPATVTTPILKSTELTSGIVDSPVPRDVPKGDLVGTLAGEFRVNESGAATFTVPIAIADGIAGVTPRITIGYTSQGGNGLLGRGWALGGLSGITRCRPTLSQDGAAKPISWTAEDRFCLDGQRLMLVPGTRNQYKTEIDAYVTVTLHGSAANPDSFTLEAKDGSVSTYGDSDNPLSKVVTAKGTLSWSISRFKDNVGNRINYVYENKLFNHHVIKRIDYAFGVASDPGAQIVFDYEARDDQSRGYIAGVEVFSTQRLKTITSYNGPSVIRAYNIQYDYAPARIGGYSRVTSVQECAEANTISAATCYKPTRFTWSTPTAPDTYAKSLGGIAHDGGKVRVTNQAFLDINGNGIQDYLWADASGAIKYALDSAVATTVRPTWLNSGSGDSAALFEPIDYNGDGHQDVLIYHPGDKKWALHLSARGAGGWTLSRTNVLSSSQVVLPFASTKDIKVGDVNSDGLADVVIKHPDDATPRITVFTLVKAGLDPSSPLFYKFDGGKDFAVESAYSLIIKGASTDKKNVEAIESFADFNGDGKVDVLLKIRHEAISFDMDYNGQLRSNRHVQFTYEIFINKENAFVSNGVLLKSGDNTDDNISTIYTPDLNADGQPDIVYMTNKTWNYMLNIGNGFTVAKTLYEKDEKDKLSSSQKISFADINHDGFTDVTWRDSEYVLDKTGNYGSISEPVTRLVKDYLTRTEVLTVYVKYWNPATSAFGAASVLLSGADADLDYNYTFMDVNGDGWTDRVATAIYGKTTDSLFNIKGFSSDADYTTLGIVPQGQITTIKNGLDNLTNINYEPIGRSNHYLPMDDIKVTGELKQTCIVYDGTKGTAPKCTTYPEFTSTAASFYTRINDPFAGLGNTEDRVPAPVLEVIGSIPVVTTVESSAPLPADPDALSRVIYSYKHMRMQAAGRGMLGFASLSTIDAQTGITTETRYRQDWPYIGSPQQTMVTTADGKLLSKATNLWDRRVVSSGSSKRYQPYLKQSIEQSYALNTDAAGAIASGAIVDEAGNVSVAPLQTVTTTTEMMDDDYGNVRQISVTTEGAGDTLVKITDNQYANDPWMDRMGRLASATVTSILNGVKDPVKKVTFDYYPQGGAGTENGLLKQEVVLDEGGNPYLTTDYQYDSKGNKTEVSVTGLAEIGREEVRKTSYVYDGNGRYLSSTHNDLKQASTIVQRHPVTGQPTEVADINGVSAEVFYDAMGKEYLRTDGTGAWSRSDTRYCSADSNCPAGAAFLTLSRVAGGGAKHPLSRYAGPRYSQQQNRF